MSDFIFVKNWEMLKSGTTGQTAYMLDSDPGGGMEELIAASTSATAACNVVKSDKSGGITIPGMKRKRYIGDDMLFGTM